jgi:squalene-associated FAD-dependent desaturase
MRAVVVGGGLAGIAAALDLLDAGQDVTLLEARPTLGGAVQTLPERDGDPSPPPDNGQHIALGCCTEYVRFLERLGQSTSVRRLRLRLPVIDERGQLGSIGAGALPLLRYSHLSVRDRVGVASVVLRMRRLDPRAHDGESFGALLRRLGASEASIERFWDVFVRPALNLPCDEASAGLGLFTVQTALLGPRAASDLLLPVAPLGAMHGDAALRALTEGGCTVRLRTRAASLEEGAVVTATGDRVDGDAFVLAVPPDESAVLLGEPAPELGDSPIVSVHMLFDRVLLAPPLAALLRSPAHWVFDRGRLTGHRPERGQYLTVVSSGVPDLAAVRGQELVELMRAALVERLGDAELLWSRVSREPQATFAGRPGTWTRRPAAATAKPNVVRASAWTQTGWPATMEGAIRSGRAAARLLLSLSARPSRAEAR